MCCLSRADAGRVDKMSERVSAVNACTSCIIYKRLHEKTAEAQFTRVNKQIKFKCTKLLCKHHTHTHDVRMGEGDKQERAQCGI